MDLMNFMKVSQGLVVKSRQLKKRIRGVMERHLADGKIGQELSAYCEVILANF